jgi:hypothetical protein
MPLEEITLTFFAISNGVRLLAYVPQIYKVSVDQNGAAAISCTTWSLFLVANIATICYAQVNRADPWLALSFGANAVCCIVIIAIAAWKRRQLASSANGRL